MRPDRGRLGWRDAAKVAGGRVQPLAGAFEIREALAQVIAQCQQRDQAAAGLALRVRLTADPALQRLAFDAERAGQVFRRQPEVRLSSLTA